MIKGERVRAGILTVDDDGAGVSTEGLHVAHALPGEEVLVDVEHVSPHGGAAWGRLVEIVRPSSERVTAACAAWSRCGGCTLAHWDYAAQLEWKRARLAAALKRTVEEVGPTVASPSPLGYRNRAKMVFGTDGERVILGAYAPRSHEVVELAGCAVVEPPLDAVAQRVASLATTLGLSVYDERTGGGLLRHALLRRNHAGAVLVLLVVARAGDRVVAELARRLCLELPSVTGVVENLNDTRGNVLVGRDADDRVLAGTPFLDERIGTVHLRTSPRAFLQANRAVAERLYGDVLFHVLTVAGAATGAATGAGPVAGGTSAASLRALDLYCGVGGIALTLAPHVGEVLGIEENESAIEDARAVAPANARFLVGDAATALERVEGRWDVVVLNPPRKGVAPSVIAACLRLAPSLLLYVSCNPSSLARDLLQLCAGGYRVERVTPYDMLPHTPHVEALAILRRMV